MDTTGLRTPQQSRSRLTLERILSSSTALITEKSYEEVSIAEIAERARISVGGFYSRFENKEALFGTLLHRLGQETDDRNVGFSWVFQPKNGDRVVAAIRASEGKKLYYKEPVKA